MSHSLVTGICCTKLEEWNSLVLMISSIKRYMKRFQSGATKLIITSFIISTISLPFFTSKKIWRRLLTPLSRVVIQLVELLIIAGGFLSLHVFEINDHLAASQLRSVYFIKITIYADVRVVRVLRKMDHPRVFEFLHFSLGDLLAFFPPARLFCWINITTPGKWEVEGQINELDEA